jgi:hypothetical protein
LPGADAIVTTMTGARGFSSAQAGAANATKETAAQSQNRHRGNFLVSA